MSLNELFYGRLPTLAYILREIVVRRSCEIMYDASKGYVYELSTMFKIV